MKPKHHPFLHQSLALAALATLTSANADNVWTGATNTDFNTGSNYVGGSYNQWTNYVFDANANSNVTGGTMNVGAINGWGNISLNSGLNTDIVIGGSQPIVMAPAKPFFGPSTGGTITINTASKDLTVNTSFLIAGTLNMNVGAGRTLTANGAVNWWSDQYDTTASLNKQGDGTVVLAAANNYQGVTTISGGTLNAATFSDYGVNGSLGNRVSDDSGNVGILFQGGTLQYTGSTAQSTNRAIRISTNGGATIDASGSVSTATLSFTATSSPDFFENPGNRSLTLTGSNTGANTFGMAIGEAGGTTSVVKNGAGKWVLTGTSNYSGATAVSQGTLQVTGSIESSAVTVSGTGTVLASGTTGTIGKGVTVNSGAILAAGGKNAVGTATVGSDGLSFASGSIFDWDLNANSTASGFDTVSTTGTLTIGSGAIFNIVLGSGVTADPFWTNPAVTRTWTNIFNYGSLVGSFADANINVSGPGAPNTGMGSFTISGTTLTWTAVPEPTSALAGLLITAGLLRRRR